MNIFRDIDEIEFDNKTVVTVGTFDGVHLAHQTILSKVKEIAESNSCRSFLITFEPHPQEILKNKTPEIKLLTTIEEKIALIENAGIDNTLIINFTEGFSKTSPQEFYERYIIKGTGLSDIVTGYDHFFGRDREGDINTLYQFAEKYGFNVHKVEEIDIEGEPVSSTRIRKYLSAGKISLANRLLGYEYGFDAIVVEGDKIGRSIGYPTVNLKPVKENKVMPDDGVYCVRITYKDNIYYGMMYHGFRPTLTEGKRKAIEVNIFDFSENIYGEKLRINLIEKLRGDKKFSSKEELVKQIELDKEATKTVINKTFKEIKINKF
ncbi:MAG: bifunctional riboflavin kinase/FAD synthetase [Ignavibacteria bacterium]|nr:bifunctional riboflavin kinase/FAD synthetase [Ignavibacteria bacterium]